eukprot:CAMPEP_0185616202 /NCGR_PEP_ID=MMETSP0436-20130131/38702_1 /TAXON_ID=626734 ORGANISM="Favella taraikaensis, Strain Fe Narragansett Bay" /NCGR_SAMPLE_ID=MMETSP0436 /ASSEMBLY_ACC=CAM_ASM_000390 /LENGTH=108 /DNA_ID=CAMNT_0028252659 /DNA_START=699 /DNA_END=1026 /DNA_ORIENTATION=+
MVGDTTAQAAGGMAVMLADQPERMDTEAEMEELDSLADMDGPSDTAGLKDMPLNSRSRIWKLSIDPGTAPPWQELLRVPKTAPSLTENEQNLFEWALGATTPSLARPL